jgi:hypothetical protein
MKQKLLFFLTIITKVSPQCNTVHYPVGLRGNVQETKYLSMDTDPTGNIVLGGSTKSSSFFQPGWPLSGTTLNYGAPIF